MGEMDSAQVEHLLKRRRIARLICESAGSRHVGTVRYYATDLPNVYLHAPDAACLELARANPAVRFEVDDIDSPGRWGAVVGWGTMEQLEGSGDPEAAGHAAVKVYRIHFERLRGFYRRGTAVQAD
jgi:nitroimidazol reductase NimA-like FMN-containing flavoprotein (pyridoxamine 5'-phosphate oxidase superfamily)